MTVGTTRRATVRLWKGALTLLLVIGTASPQHSTVSNEAAPSVYSELITESPSGSVAPLRKEQPIVDSASTTLKNVDDVPRSNVEDRYDDESSDVLTIESNGSHNDQRLLDSKSENLKIEGPLTKVTRIDEKLGNNGGSLEFGENDDNGEIDDLLDENDREPTTKTPKINVDENNATPTSTKSKGKDHVDDGTKPKNPKIGISLANDTNVNYNNKNLVKDSNDAVGSGDDAKGSPTVLENATNVIASGSDVADEREKGKGPKAQVEVVRNSTLPKVMRISEAVADEKRKEVENLGPAENASVVSTTESTVIHESNNLETVKEKTEDSTLGNVPNVVKENHNPTNVSHIPKGRTIAFGGVNEFVTVDNKTVEPIGVDGGISDRPINEITTGVTDQPIKDFKPNDFKPYPYSKTGYPTNSSEGDSTDDARVAESTEETSALENTIGQRQPDKKFVVTEPSVVIDNSIQQFKSTDYKKSENSSRLTTSLDAIMRTTVASLVGEVNEESMPSNKSIALGNDTTIFVGSLPVFNAENDVPRGKDKVAEPSVSAKDTGKNLDLTGNGITEVIAGIKNDSVRAIEDSSATVLNFTTTSGIPVFRATENPLVQTSDTEKNTTTSDNVALTNVDVQTDPEESMLKISSLNVTEGSTKINFNQEPQNLTDFTSSTSTLIPKIPFESNSDSESQSMSTSFPSKTLSTSTLMPESSLLSTTIPEDSSVSTLTIETTSMSNAVPKMSSTSKLSPLISSVTTASPPTPSEPSNATSASLLIAELKVPTATAVPEEFTDDVAPKAFETEPSFNSDDPPESTTSNIEYVFVGLSESTLQPFASTSESPNAVSFDREFALPTSPSVNRTLTLSEESTSESTTIGTPGNENESTAKTNASEQTSPDSATMIAESDDTQDFTTRASSREFTTAEYSTKSTNEDTTESTTTMDNTETTQPNVSVKATTEPLTALTNSTDVPGIVPDTIKNTTDTGRAVDSSTSVPEATVATAENSNATIIGPAETTNLSITTELPDVSEIPNVSRNFTVERSRENVTSERPEVDSDPKISTTKFTTLRPRADESTTTEKTIEIVTEEFIEISNRGEVPSLVKVVFEGSWADVCPHLDVLRQSLADLLTSGLEKPVLASQIIFQQNACSAGSSTVTGTTILPITTLLLYVVDGNGNFDSEMTKMLPTLYSKSPIKLQVNIRSFQLVQDTDSGNAIAVLVVSCVALICLVLLAGLLFIMRKRQTRFNYGERCRPVSLDAYSLDSVSAYNSVRRKGASRASKISYGNPTFEDSSAIPSHPLNFAGLSTFCNEQNAIAEEFAGIPQVTARIDELPPGAEVKNRYANVVPLPETRVSLMKINNDPLTEYINASYVRGSKSATKYYIACQGPIESTVTDFWRMIWEQQSKVIIMLTDLVENGVEKCAEYLPPSEVTDCHRLFGDFQITLKRRETKEKYAISTLNLKNLENNTFREISHIWYLWPANGVQSDAAGLIAVLLEARALQRGGPGPIVVHCSPGTGRTGTLIALDLGIRQYEITRTVDVPRVVYTIRRDRAGAVQTKGQYAFIYKALNLYATKLAGGALES